MVNIGVIGYGYWGPNIVRNFKAIEKAKVSIVCDIDCEALKRIHKVYSDVKTVSDPSEVLTSPVIDAVAIITPVFTHYELAKKALENGKHIFVGKPFTSKVGEAEELIELSERNNLKIMVDHTFLFTGAVKKIKEIIDDNLLGKLYYYDSTRVNLGLFQHDVNVLWDLVPHDLSIMDYLLEEEPVAIVATGSEHFGRGLEDVAFLTVYFNNNLISHFNVNWLSPVKIRSTLIGGEKKMLVWNDLEQDEKIKLYDKGVEVKTKGGLYNLLIDYRSGDMWSPLVDRTEALKVESEYFVDCILNNKDPINDGCSGLRVVKILEASNESLKKKGKLVEL